MKQIYFFGLREDLIPMLEMVENKGFLKYALMGNFLKKDWKNLVFESGTQIPNLGKATSDHWNGCDAYLVCQGELPINFRVFQGVEGERVCVDQLVNPDSVEFNPGGVWKENVVLNGRIATASESKVSQALMRRFQGAIKKTFSKVKAFYVGPKALALLKNGQRFVGAVQSPPELDLILPNEKS